jgi:hypothetical protein
VKRVIGEKAISPKFEGSSGGCRKWLLGSELTFGINNIFDTAPPFADATAGFDTQITNASVATSASKSRKSSKSPF